MPATVTLTRHLIGVQIRRGKFDVLVDGQVVACRCSEKRLLPIFLASFVVPSLGISLTRRHGRI